MGRASLTYKITTTLDLVSDPRSKSFRTLIVSSISCQQPLPIRRSSPSLFPSLLPSPLPSSLGDVRTP